MNITLFLIKIALQAYMTCWWNLFNRKSNLMILVGVCGFLDVSTIIQCFV